MTKKNLVNYLNHRLSPQYGSLRGFLRTILHRLFFYLGQYSEYKRVEWDKVERLVFVCQGNICRSAFAEEVARSLKLNAVSCGIDTDDGKPANEMAIRIAADKGFNLNEHRTRKINSLKLEKGDLLIAMEPKQVKFLKTFIKAQYTCTLLGIWKAPVMPYIHDPYSATSRYFDNCFDYILKAVCVIEQKLNKL